MNYSLEKIIEQFDQEEKMKFVFFWGHTPNPDGSVSKSCFSQWWEQTFYYEELAFLSAEHWMMYQKAALFKDEEIQKKILSVKSPAEAKKLGRAVRNFDQQVWEENRYQIVIDGNVLKFSQDEALKTFLLNTNKRVLVEASPVDNIWGIGLAQDAANIQNPHTWEGPNLLGFALMEVRDQLRNE